MVRTRLTAYALVTALLAVAGCGGGGSGASTLGSIPQVSNPATKATAKSAAPQAGHRRSAKAHAKAMTRHKTIGATGKTQPASTGKADATRASFIRSADQICAQAHSRLAKLSGELAAAAAAVQKHKIEAKAYLARAGSLTEQSASIAAGAVSRIRGLDRPEDPRIDRYLAASTKQAQLLASQGKAIARGDGGTIHDINDQSVGVRKRAHDAAQSYGFHVCGGTSQ